MSLISADPLQAVEDFEQHHPDVLVLAFNELGKSEHYYLELYRLCQGIHLNPPRSIILCNKESLNNYLDF